METTLCRLFTETQETGSKWDISPVDNISGRKSVKTDSNVINLIDSRASTLGPKAKKWITAAALILPFAIGWVSFADWPVEQAWDRGQTHGLLLQVILGSLASVCFVSIFSRGVQRQRRGPQLTSFAFLFMAVAIMSNTIGSMSSFAALTVDGGDMALFLGLIINFGTAMFMATGEFFGGRTGKSSVRSLGLFVAATALAVPIAMSNVHVTGSLGTFLTALSSLALPAYGYVAIKQGFRFRKEWEPMRLATAAFAIGGMATHVIYLAGEGPESALIQGRQVLICALASPILVLIAKDSLALHRSLPAQVRLVFNAIVSVVIVCTISVVNHIDTTMANLQSGSEMEHLFGVQQHTVILMAAVILLATCIAMLGATNRLRRFLDNVENLVSATRSLAKGKHNGLVHEQGEDELGVLTVAFNAMAERLYLQNQELQILAHVMGGTSDPVIVLSPDRHVVYSNRAFSKKTGWERSQIIGCRYETLFSEGTSRNRIQSLCEGTSEGESCTGELNIDIQGGGRLSSIVTIAPVERDKETIYYVAVHHDQRAIIQVKEERARYTQSLLDLHRVAQNIVEVLDLQEVMRRAVVGIEVTFGVKARIWMKEAAQFCSSCDHKVHCEKRHHCLKLFGTRAAGTICHPLHEGFLGQAVRTLENQVSPFPQSQKELFVCDTEDKDMQGGRAAYPLVSAGACLGVLELAFDSSISESPMPVFGLLSQTLAEAIFNAKNHEEMARQARTMEELTEELKLAVGVEMNQAFELRQLNDKLIEADRIKNNFLSTTSHELRSPISGMMGYLQLIMDDMAEDRDEEMEFVRGAHEQAENLLDVINDVLDLAKIDSGQTRMDPEDFEIDPLLGEAKSSLEKEASKKGIEIKLIPCDAPIEAHGDYIRMVQIMSIIVGNAIKFSDEGTITISATCQRERGFTEIRVTDEGIGLEAKDQVRIFDAFVQADGSDSRRFGGSGLGLTLARDLLNMMGGTIRVQSDGIGHGTTVRVTLPICAPDEEEEIVVDFPGQTAIVVGLDQNFVDTAKKALSPIGARVVTARTAAEAMELVHQLQPRWVLSEFILPHNNHPRLRNGIDLGRAIGAIKEFSVEFCVATGHAPEVLIEACDDTILCGMLQKPISESDIDDRLSLLPIKAAFAMKARILVVDGDEATVVGLRNALRDTPFTIESTTNPEVAITCLTDSKRPIDLLILDMGIPGSGLYELLEVAKDMVASERIALLLLHKDHESALQSRDIFSRFGNSVESIEKALIEQSPQRFIDLIVGSLTAKARLGTSEEVKNIDTRSLQP